MDDNDAVVDLGGSARTQPSVRPRTHPLPRALLWGAVYYAATWLGTLTLVPSGLLTLASPAVGVAALWFVFGSRRTWGWDAAVLVLCTVVTNLRLDAPTLLVVTSPLVSLLQVAAFLVALRALAPGLQVDGGMTRTLSTLRDLSGFLLAAGIAATVSAVGTNLTQAAAGLSTGDPRFLLIRWGRNASTIVVIGAVGLILGPTLYRAIRQRALGRMVRSKLEEWRAATLVEGVILTAVSLVLYVVCFRYAEGYPVAFLLFVTTAWVGLRYSPGAIALHSLLTGTLAVWFTVLGDGVFGRLDPVLGAALVQLFVLVTTCTGLVLGLSRAALRAAEQRSTQHAQMLDTVLSEVDDGILLMDETGAILMINPAGRRLLDLRETADGRPELAEGTVLAHPDGTPLTRRDSLWRRALAGEELRDEEVHLRSPEGDVRRVLRVSGRLLPQDGERPRILVGYHDVTADRIQREALVKFAGEVAHDLKNPLAVVSGWTDAMLEELEAGSLSAEVGGPMARRVQSAAGHMQDFIGQMLDFTVARDQALRPVEVDLGDLASRVAALRVDGAGDGPVPVITVDGRESVWADPLLVRVLLDNLVGNAIKYVSADVEPEVAIRIHAVDADWVAVAVRDNGIGITYQQRDRLFEAFARVEQEGYQGTGLGLAICQRIVQRHGGVITIEAPSDGAGTTFSFTLPRTQAAYDAARSAQDSG